MRATSASRAACSWPVRRRQLLGARVAPDARASPARSARSPTQRAARRRRCQPPGGGKLDAGLRVRRRCAAARRGAARPSWRPSAACCRSRAAAGRRRAATRRTPCTRSQGTRVQAAPAARSRVRPRGARVRAEVDVLQPLGATGACRSGSWRCRRGRASPGRARRSQPPASRCVANVWRSVCGLIFSVEPGGARVALDDLVEALAGQALRRAG